MPVRVYVESNFFLEIGLDQEQRPDAASLLDLAENGTIEIRAPELAIYEPFSTVSHRARERKKLVKLIEEQLKGLRRSASRQDVTKTIQEAIDRLVEMDGTELRDLQDVIGRMLRLGPPLRLSPASFTRSFEFQVEFGLDSKDGLIFATIVQDLEGTDAPRGRSVFVTRNSEDFRSPAIVEMLRERGCEATFSFDEALRFASAL
ncbi:MAG TPA: PIN domain-containing protein [Vulgatibacter sp.]